MRLNVAWLNITSNCNLKCRWCYASSHLNQSATLFDQNHTINDLLKILKASGAKHLVFIGGEPTCLSVLPEYIKVATSYEFEVSLATNGLALSNYEYAHNLYEAGLRNIDISSKGYCDSSYFANTGVDGYKLFLQGIQNCLELGFNFTVSQVFLNDRKESALKHFQLLDSYGVEHYFFSFERGCTLCHRSKKDRQAETRRIAQSFVAFENAFLEIKELLDKKFIVEQVIPRCLWNKDILTSLEKDNQLTKYCHVQTGNGIVISQKRDLLLCNALDSISLGKWGEEFNNESELEIIYKKDKTKSLLKDLLRLPESKCSSCFDMVNCLGGCPIQWFTYSLEEIENEIGKLRCS